MPRACPCPGDTHPGLSSERGAALCAAPPRPGGNGIATGTRSPRGYLVTSPDPTLPWAAPAATAALAGSFAKLSLPPFPASPPEQKAGVSLRQGLSREELGRSHEELGNRRTRGGFGDTEAAPNEEASVEM